MSFIFAECVPTGQPHTDINTCLDLMQFAQGMQVQGTYTRALVKPLAGVDMYLWLMRDVAVHNDDLYVILNLGLTMDEFLAEIGKLNDEQSGKVVPLRPMPAPLQVEAAITLRGIYGDVVNKVYTSDTMPHLTVLTFPDAAPKLRKEFAEGNRSKLKPV